VIVKTEPTFICEIFIAGEMADIERECANYCMEGLCVSIEPVKYIYTGGRETGAVVRLLNYPRFPATPTAIRARATILAKRLMKVCFQTSAMIVDRERTEWLTTRQDQ